MNIQELNIINAQGYEIPANQYIQMTSQNTTDVKNLLATDNIDTVDDDIELAENASEVKAFSAFDSSGYNHGGYAGTGFASKEGYESAIDFVYQAVIAADTSYDFSGNTTGWVTTEGMDKTNKTVQQAVQSGVFVDLDKEDFTKDVEDLIKHSEAERKANNNNAQRLQDYVEAERLHYLLSLKLKKTCNSDEKRCIKNLMLKCLAVMADLTTSHDYTHIFNL